MKTRIKIYGVPSRAEMMNATIQKLSIPTEDVFFDDRPNGGDSLYTAKKAWLSDWGDATHAVVLQDDCEVCDCFLEFCQRIITAHSDVIVSLFPFDYLEGNKPLNTQDSPYYECKIVSGVAIIMPVQYINSCFEWIKNTYNDNIPDDEGITMWAKCHKIKTITTLPALVQHIGDVSVLNSERRIRKTTYYSKNPEADFESEFIYQLRKFPPKRVLSKKISMEWRNEN